MCKKGTDYLYGGRHFQNIDKNDSTLDPKEFIMITIKDDIVNSWNSKLMLEIKKKIKDPMANNNFIVMEVS